MSMLLWSGLLSGFECMGLFQPVHVLHEVWGTLLRSGSGFLESNLYVLVPESGGVVLVDPGLVDVSGLLAWLDACGRDISAVLLTHEHVDHCLGVNALAAFRPFELICAEACSRNIGCSRQNFSRYHNSIDEFVITQQARVVHDGERVTLSGIRLEFIETPGHSPGSMCIAASGSLFTGDTLLDGPTPLRFPHSSKRAYAVSMLKLHTYITPKMLICPGHGQPFIAC